MAAEAGQEPARDDDRSLQRPGSIAMSWPRFGPWMPALDVRDDGNEVVVEAEIPGVDPKDIQVECRDDTLIIHGQSEEREEEDRRVSHRSGSFYAELPIPPGVDVDKARASHRHGVLTIHLPKLPGRQGQYVKRIPITRAA